MNNEKIIFSELAKKIPKILEEDSSNKNDNESLADSEENELNNFEQRTSLTIREFTK